MANINQDNRLEKTGLEIINREKKIKFNYNDTIIEAYEGDTIASALYSNNTRIFSRSYKYHRPRGLFCVSGKCPNCLMTVDDEPNVRVCNRKVKEGMNVKHQNAWPSLKFDILSILDKFDFLMPVGFYYKQFIKPKMSWMIARKIIRRITGLADVIENNQNTKYEHFNKHVDVAIIGGGPSGLSAAIEASKKKISVLLIDDQEELGGHLRYQTRKYPQLSEYKNLAGFEIARELRNQIEDTDNIETVNNALCVGIYEDNLVVYKDGNNLVKLRPKQTIITTGSRDRQYVFNNNDIPGVMLGNGLRKLVNLYRVDPGKKIIIFTNNQTGYDLGIDLIESKITSLTIIDPRKNQVVNEEQKAIFDKYNVKIQTGVIIEAKGKNKVEGVLISQSDETETANQHEIKCDIIAIAVGFEPETSLLYLAGGKMEYDEKIGEIIPKKIPEKTHIAGEITGIHDLEISLLQGRLVGLKSTLDLMGETDPKDKELDNQVKKLEVKYREKIECKHLFSNPVKGKKKFVCICEDVTEKDIVNAIEEGFDVVETLKRYTTVSMGPCQGKTCSFSSIAVCANAVNENIVDVGTTVTRPPYDPIPLGLIAGTHQNPMKLSSLHYQQLELGAELMNMGEWKRPHNFGALDEEYYAVRERVGVIDLSTLGKFEVVGNDAGSFLDKVYGHKFSNMKIGKARYALLSDDSGIILDDGIIARLDENRYYVSSSTGNVESVEQWLKWWIVGTGQCVHITNLTSKNAAINVAGPNSEILLSKLTDTDLSNDEFKYMNASETTIAGVPAIFLKIGFVGEKGWEIHFPSEYSEYLWNVIMDYGLEYGIKPFGVETQRRLRLDKKHIIVGVDTDSTSNALEADHKWAVKFEKEDFIGKYSLQNISERGLENGLVGFIAQSERKLEDGNVVVDGEGVPIGRVTSARYSLILKKDIGLAWIPQSSIKRKKQITIINNKKKIKAKISLDPFYDPKGERMRK